MNEYIFLFLTESASINKMIKVELNIKENFPLMEETKNKILIKYFENNSFVLEILIFELNKQILSIIALEQAKNNCGFGEDAKNINTGEEISNNKIKQSFLANFLQTPINPIKPEN